MQEEAVLSSGLEETVSEQSYTSMTGEEFGAKCAALNPPVEPVKRKKVAILGFTESFKLAPWGDPEFEIWGLNELYMLISQVPGGRWDRWFEVHSREVYEADKKRVSDHVEKLKQMTCPVYMHRHWDDIPASVAYPFEAVAQAFPNPTPGARPYLTNTITYMIMLAILEGFEEIHIYGVDMAHATEYGSQRPSCEWAVGLAAGRGIKVYIPPQADLMKTLFCYGYETPQSNFFDEKLRARKVELQGKIDALQNEINQRSQALHQYLGAIQDVDWMLTNWSSLHS